MKKLLAILLLCFYPAVAAGQAPVKQSGNVTPNHIPYWVTTGVIGDGGTAANGKITSLGITASGPSFCINSAAITTAGWQQMCFGVTTAGGGTISLQNFGTASPQNFTVTINGTAYPFPFSIAGILGPNPTVIGDLACWNNTVGTLLADCGASAGVPANVLNTQTTNYQIATNDCGKTIQAGTGSTGFFTITVPSVSGFATNCVVTILNGDTARGKAISGFTGCSSRNIIWPLQACTIGIVNGAWQALSRPGRWRPPSSSTLNFFTDFNNGSDAVGATDGLASGAAAFKSAEWCFLNANDQIDYNSVSQTVIVCNMAAATSDTQGMHAPVHALVGAQGGAAIQIVGASLPITGAISNGGLCEITISSTGSYSLNTQVSVYNVAGATGCNGTWKVTVTDGTHLTLQGTTFGGAYTSGGTVTNSSGFNVTGVAVACYFGTVIQFTNINFYSTQQSLQPNGGCKVYLQPGNIFGGTPGSHILISAQAQVRVNGDIGISSGATNAFVQAQSQGLFFNEGGTNINFIPSTANPSFSGLGFAYADTQGQANFAGLTINLNSNTITGTRCQALTLGLANSGTAAPNTYFPGNSNCVTATGGIAN